MAAELEPRREEVTKLREELDAHDTELVKELKRVGQLSRTVGGARPDKGGLASRAPECGAAAAAGS